MKHNLNPSAGCKHIAVAKKKDTWNAVRTVPSSTFNHCKKYATSERQLARNSTTCSSSPPTHLLSAFHPQTLIPRHTPHSADPLTRSFTPLFFCHLRQRPIHPIRLDRGTSDSFFIDVSEHKFQVLAISCLVVAKGQDANRDLKDIQFQDAGAGVL